MDDVISLCEMIELRGVENEKRAGKAYGLAKMSICDEMEEFDNYQIMKKVEFIEWIGRMAELVYPGVETMLLDKKI